ncbi:glycosyl transferase family 2 [Nonlabens dokdonensis]|jgi:glycosyltransferase involved in cell wall biosynthesis|uniref:Glycosyl transferase family 2 n=2 Tax=Nonlabens dokdonensis TaxID=328515 RepID=A0ABX5PYE8_9FLAO|nr:glycosyltransferase family 2 protein [Nonlabens dokdonensis]AGC77411.1 putative glycosyl transferase [Nonlabens dokdonensis DSW-6]PZX40937.1 glycosyl transferase family 2 [Nonlabens dokdonensis]
MISIIIATYNRAAYIAETLSAIQNQTYGDFECIIIDDGSTDHTDEIVQEFVNNDERFIYLQRPERVPKGANFSRNYGYTLSKGDYVKFFDSDDVMLPHHLETSMKYLKEGNYDFVVGDCVNFDETGLLERPYEIDRTTAELTAMRFADFKTAWITNDLLVKRKYADQIEFLAGLRDQATEYQYNIKLLLLTENGFLINEILTHRRIHDQGIVEMAKKDMNVFKATTADNFLATVNYFKNSGAIKMNKWMLSSQLQINYELAKSKVMPEKIWKTTSLLVKFFGGKGILYPFAIGVTYLTGKGYAIMKYIRS